MLLRTISRAFSRAHIQSTAVYTRSLAVKSHARVYRRIFHFQTQQITSSTLESFYLQTRKYSQIFGNEKTQPQPQGSSFDQFFKEATQELTTVRGKSAQFYNLSQNSMIRCSSQCD
jgi:hypothetical protein